jgi:hypothetical protein
MPNQPAANSRRVTFVIDEEDKQAIIDASKRYGVSMGAMLRQAAAKVIQEIEDNNSLNTRPVFRSKPSKK